MKKNRPSIAGLGVLYYDLLVRNRKSDSIYLGGRGGGSTANFLSNCAAFGAECRFIGACGDDAYGALALADLEDARVSANLIRKVDKRNTRIIFQTSGLENELSVGADSHVFGTTCPCCGNSEPEATLKSLPENLIRSDYVAGSDVLYFDSISRNKARLVDEVKDLSKTKFVVDLGRVGSMRYMSVGEISSILNRFDLIFCSALVARSLMRRIGIGDFHALAKHLPSSAIVIADGANGVTSIAVDSKGLVISRRVTAPMCDLIDAAGAGDAFLAGGIMRLIELGWARTKGPIKAKYLEEFLVAGTSSAASVLEVLGARGHLAVGGLNGLRKYSHSPKSCGRKLSDLVNEASRRGGCVLCDRIEKIADSAARPSREKKAIKVYPRNTDNLFSRMSQVSVDGMGDADYANLLLGCSTAVLIGTGGSFPVCLFLADLLAESGRCLALAMHPLQYVKTPRKVDLMMVMSYSGGTSDCAAAIEEAKRLGVKRFILVTGNPSGRLKDLVPATGVVAYERDSKLEKGFVSIRGTILPCSWFIARSKYRKKFVDLISSLSERCLVSPSDFLLDVKKAVLGKFMEGFELIFETYGSGYSLPAMNDFEGKITEGGAGIVRIHESKDFSHGRFMSIMNGRSPASLIIGIVFCIGEATSYEKKLIASLKKYQPVITVSSRFTGVLGGLELLVIVQFLVRYIGEALGRDLSRPASIPQKGLALYKWRQTLD